VETGCGQAGQNKKLISEENWTFGLASPRTSHLRSNSIWLHGGYWPLARPGALPSEICVPVAGTLWLRYANLACPAHVRTDQRCTNDTGSHG
jgi:hypothetical protein